MSILEHVHEGVGMRKTGRKRVDATKVNAAKLTRGAIAKSVKYVKWFDSNQDGRIRASELLQITQRKGMLFNY